MVFESRRELAVGSFQQSSNCTLESAQFSLFVGGRSLCSSFLGVSSSRSLASCCLTVWRFSKEPATVVIGYGTIYIARKHCGFNMNHYGIRNKV